MQLLHASLYHRWPALPAPRGDTPACLSRAPIDDPTVPSKDRMRSRSRAFGAPKAGSVGGGCDSAAGGGMPVGRSSVRRVGMVATGARWTSGFANTLLGVLGDCARLRTAGGLGGGDVATVIACCEQAPQAIRCGEDGAAGCVLGRRTRQRTLGSGMVPRLTTCARGASCFTSVGSGAMASEPSFSTLILAYSPGFTFRSNEKYNVISSSRWRFSRFSSSLLERWIPNTASKARPGESSCHASRHDTPLQAAVPGPHILVSPPATLARAGVTSQSLHCTSTTQYNN